MEENKLYDLQDEPLRLNRFVCEITLDGVEIDSRVVRGFREDKWMGVIYVDIASYENTDYEWLIEKVYDEKADGKLVIKWLSPSLEIVKVVKYKLLSISEIFYPEHKYNVNGVVSTKVGFKYTDKHIEYLRSSGKNNKPISENDKAFLKASKELLEDAKKRVEDKYAIYENAEGTKNRVIDQLNMAERENDEFAKQVGCSDEDIENAKYKEPNGLYVERYNKRMEEYNKINNDVKECIKECYKHLKKMFGENMGVEHKQEKYENKKYETSFDFGDFNTALEWYKYHMIPNDKQYVKVDKFDDIDRDIEQNERPTVVVCSRQCGMTTHMAVWSLAMISTAMHCNVWYVTSNKCEIFEILKHIPEEIRNLCFLKFDNTHFIIKNTQTNSEINFVTINRNILDFFHDKELPDYVIYDDMACYNTSKLNEFMNCMDVKRKPNHQVKEICTSTPSKGGSIFNFIALTAPNVIRIPWYECKGCGGRQNSKPFEGEVWVKKMKKLLGEDNFNVELNCQIGCDEDKTNFNKEKFPDDYGYVFFDTDFPVSEKEDAEYEIEI